MLASADFAFEAAKRVALVGALAYSARVVSSPLLSHFVLGLWFIFGLWLTGSANRALRKVLAPPPLALGGAGDFFTTLAAMVIGMSVTVALAWVAYDLAAAAGRS